MDHQLPTSHKKHKAVTTAASKKETPVRSHSTRSKPVAVVQPITNVVSEGVAPSGGTAGPSSSNTHRTQIRHNNPQFGASSTTERARRASPTGTMVGFGASTSSQQTVTHASRSRTSGARTESFHPYPRGTQRSARTCRLHGSYEPERRTCGCFTYAVPTHCSGCCTPRYSGCCTPRYAGCCTPRYSGCCTPRYAGCCTPHCSGCCTPRVCKCNIRE